MLLRYCKHIPGGVLVFLPSYELIQRISDEWFHTTGHHSQISKHKKIVFETGGSRGFDETIEDFNDGLKKKGSLLFAVFRGKCSEGLDFKDNRATAKYKSRNSSTRRLTEDTNTYSTAVDGTNIKRFVRITKP